MKRRQFECGIFCKDCGKLTLKYCVEFERHYSLWYVEVVARGDVAGNRASSRLCTSLL